MKTSCGVLILNEFKELLLCHSTGNSFFDIPKGGKEDGETEKEAAMRECKEEAGLLFAPERLSDIGLFPYNKEKNLHLFLVNVKKEEIDLNKLICTSFFEDFRTKKQKTEVDGYEWIDLDRLNSVCAKSMGKLLSTLKDTKIFDAKEKSESKKCPRI